MMGTKTRSRLWCLVFLCLAEGGLRWSERQLVPEGGLPAGRPIYIALGTSRTLRSIRPKIVTEILAREGVESPLVANVSDVGRTMVGMYQQYMQRLHPRLNDSLDKAILAIEVRGAGFNDSHLEEREQLYVRQEQFDPRVDSDVEAPAAYDFEALAQGIAGQLALTRAGETLDRWREPETLDAPYWMQDHGGWTPFERPAPPDLNATRNGERYRGELLANYALGGVQTAYLRRLVRQAQEDGWTVMLYVTPITRTQREFWKPEDFARFSAHLREFAREEGVPVLDFDDGHDFNLGEFFDTHHLNRRGSRRFSRMWGEMLAKVPVK